MEIDLEKYRVKPGEHVNLSNFDANDTGDFDGDKSDGKDLLDDLTDQLEDLQERLYAEQKHSILIVLQGMDTSGKDGTVEHVFEGVNPQGVRVANFKAPTLQELSHDFLWRIHQKTPARGEITIFNRSHYEDVLIVRVKDLVPEKVWSRRYGHINNFEHLLVDEGTTILKFYLHITLEEQKERLLDRLEEKDKHWKFNPEDLKERKRWDSYIRAYEDALSMTSTEWAPWYIVPANRKWFRNLFVATVLVGTLKQLDPQPPKMWKESELEEYISKVKEA